MISNNTIKKIIDDCKVAGHEVGIRDVSFAYLCYAFEDAKVAYRALFGNDADFDPEQFDSYCKESSIEYLRAYISANYPLKRKGRPSSDEIDNITFEENRQGIISLISQTEDAIQNKQIAKKDGLKILADLRVKLTDKFNIQDEQIEQMVVVEKKYNAVCEHCHHEIYIPTKEELIEQYNLVERNDDRNNDKNSKN